MTVLRRMLTCFIEFHVCGSPDESNTFAFQYKDNLAENYARMRYTAVQNMSDVKSAVDEITKRDPVTVEVVKRILCIGPVCVGKREHL